MVWPGIGQPQAVPLSLINGISDLKRFIKFSMATYGHAPLKFLGVLDFGQASTSEEAVALLTGTSSADLVSCEWAPQVFNPGFVLCVDSETESVVLAIRGTLWPHDALTDFSCHAEPLELKFPAELPDDFGCSNSLVRGCVHS